MLLQKSFFRLFVISLFSITVFLGTVNHSFASTPTKEGNSVVNKNSTVIKEQMEEMNDNINTTTSKISLDNKKNEDLDEIVKSDQLTITNIADSQSDSPIGKKSYSTKEIEMMAKMVNGEARGEMMKGKVAVAAVILNRVESPQFPNTVSKVLFQDGAFTAVDDGQFQKSPNYDAYHAVYLAIKGMDPTKNAIFYYNPEIATSDWIFTRPETVKIGKHVFAK